MIKILAILVMSVFATKAAALELNPLFQDNAVLQCNAPVPVWGSGREGERITVTFGGKSQRTTVSDGVWKVLFQPMAPNAAPQTLTVKGDTVHEVKNVLVGEVWLAGGQSNMERQLGPRGGQQPIHDWKAEAAAADYPQIRQFYVRQNLSFSPQTAVKGQWDVCSPETVENFTAVGYFFARDLFAARKVPVGIIHSSWGGTPAEAWTSGAGLRDLPGFAEQVAEVNRFAADPALAEKKKQQKLAEWYEKVDPGSRPSAAWSAAELEVGDWAEVTLPGFLEDQGNPGFDGIFWYRREFTMPASWDGGDAELRLGAIDDLDTTWINGAFAGAKSGGNVPRIYRVPGARLKHGTNVITVRALDLGGGGGLIGGEEMRLAIRAGGTQESIPLSGSWRGKPGVTMKECGWPPQDFPGTPTVLYNGMIAPLAPYAISGVIWYQGENNVGRERQYRRLFPALIADWRKTWGQGDFPFLFVQIAPFVALTPEIREAQLLSWQNTINTAMIVTLDCGDARDIHPTHKQPVGARLALAARALAYHEKIEYSGPLVHSMKTQGATAILRFQYLGGGLVAKDGELRGFTIAGEDKVFHPAQAKIEGATVIVQSQEVPRPIAVRYAWANVPEGNLFNRAGLPASPFRTDMD